MKQSILSIEFIGKIVKVVNKDIQGKIINETKNTFIIKQKNSKKIIQKKNNSFEIENKIIDGSMILMRPEERIRIEK